MRKIGRFHDICALADTFIQREANYRIIPNDIGTLLIHTSLIQSYHERL